MRDDIVEHHFTLDDVLKQLVNVLVGRRLATNQLDAFVEKLPYREVVIGRDVNAEHRHYAAAPHGAHAGFEDFRRAFFKVDDGLGAVEQVAVGLEAYAIDAYVGAATFTHVADDLHH